ncbi:hypothetical protein [Geoglobus ahangari]
MTGKTLTINDLMKVPATPAQPVQPGKVVVPAQPVEEDEDISLLELLERINAFVANVNRLTENVKELIGNLAENADKLMLPEGIASKVRMFQALGSFRSAELPGQGGIDVNAILRTFEQLPDDMPVGELKKMVKSVLGGADAGAGKADSKGQEG